MEDSKNKISLKAELKTKTDEFVSTNKELFVNLSKEEITNKKKERAKEFRGKNQKLLSDTNNERISGLAQKYLFEQPDLFKMDDSLSWEERKSRIDEIVNEKIEIINREVSISNRDKEQLKEFATVIKQDDFDKNPNFVHIKKEHSDIILDTNKEEKNKFILIALHENNLDKNIFFDIVIDTNNSRSANKENALRVLKSLSEKHKDEEEKIKYFAEKIFRGSIKNNIIIARPMIAPFGEPFGQHYQLAEKFAREHKNFTLDDRTFSGYKIESPTSIFGEDKKEEIENFVKGFIKIIENETDYDIAMEKYKNLSKPTDLIPTYSVLGGWYVKLDENEKLSFGGNSERYGYLLDNRSKRSLYKDFTKDEYES